MKATGDAAKLLRTIKVYDRAKARMREILQADAPDTTKVERMKAIVLQANKKVGKILQSKIKQM